MFFYGHKNFTVLFFSALIYLHFFNNNAIFGDSMSIPTRDQLPQKDCWDISKIYPSMDEWKIDYENVKMSPLWENITSYQNRLSESPLILKEAIDQYLSLERDIEKIYIYPHLYLDQDLGNDEAKDAFGRAQMLFAMFQEKTSWMEPEMLQIDDKTFLSYINDPTLKDYKFFLQKIYNLKPHTLSLVEEKILALATQPFLTPYKTFGALNNADLSFDPIKNSKGQILEMSHGKYSSYMKEPDRVLRKNAYESSKKKYLEFENTICELLQGQIKTHEFFAKTRKYNNSLEAALSINNIDVGVYYNLINTVRENLPVLHKFISMKKKILGLDHFKPYDIYAPLVKEIDYKKSLDEAKEIVINSVAPLGKEYQQILKKGLYDEKWVDFLENKKKRSGAYSSGGYDTNPYILMNYHGTLNDMSTLAHEAGHSMHSYLSNHAQEYAYANYSIFLAEIASTFNEQLLQDYLLQNAENNEFKAYLIADSLDRLQATFFRQTLFAEFELKIHELVEKGQPLTPSILKEIYLDLYKDYYGKDMELDDYIAIEWAKIPHFYYNFYVYQYATGISAATHLYNLSKEDKNVCQQYIKFLQSGGSQYPLDILKNAGCDLTNPGVIESLIEYFNAQMDKLSNLLEN